MRLPACGGAGDSAGRRPSGHSRDMSIDGGAAAGLAGHGVHPRVSAADSSVGWTPIAEDVPPPACPPAALAVKCLLDNVLRLATACRAAAQPSRDVDDNRNDYGAPRVARTQRAPHIPHHRNNRRDPTRPHPRRKRRGARRARPSSPRRRRSICCSSTTRARACAGAGRQPTPSCPSWRASFCDALRIAVHDAVPRARVSRRHRRPGGATPTAAEHVARALVGRRQPRVPVSAVRGSNLLGILDYLVADGLKLDNVETGAPVARRCASRCSPPTCNSARAVRDGAGRRRPRHRRRLLRRRRAGDRRRRARVRLVVEANSTAWQAPRRRPGRRSGRIRTPANGLAAAGHLPATHVHPRIELGDDGAFTVDLSPPLRTRPTHADCWRGCKPADRETRPTGTPTCGSTPPSATSTRTGPTSFASRAARARRPTTTGGSTCSTRPAISPKRWWNSPPARQLQLRRQIAEAFRAHFATPTTSTHWSRCRSCASADGDARRKLAPPGLSLEAAAAVRGVRRASRRFAAANPAVVRLPAGAPSCKPSASLWPRASRATPSTSPSTRGRAKEWE